MGEVEPFELHPFAGGMEVRLLRLRGWSSAGWCGRAAGFDGPAVAVAEGQPVGQVGVALDGELAAMVLMVVALAEAAEVGGVRSAAVCPVGDVVDLQSCR